MDWQKWVEKQPGVELVDTWQKEDVCYAITRVGRERYEKVLAEASDDVRRWSSLRPHYCGYCAFLGCPFEQLYKIAHLEDVHIHGGITYTGDQDGWSIYGFDCGHAGDQLDIRYRSVEWLASECERMARGIVAEREMALRRCEKALAHWRKEG